MLTGATDMAQLRARGVHAYGLDPPASIEESAGVHGNDERISVAGVRQFVQFVFEAVTAVAAAPGPASSAVSFVPAPRNTRLPGADKSGKLR
jgi:hypothetical protein